MADGQFDDLLMALASKHKNVEELSFSILSFFERRTDLFHIMESSTDRMGFGPGMAEKMFFKHFQFFQTRYASREQPQLLEAMARAANSNSSGTAVTDGPPEITETSNAQQVAPAAASRVEQPAPEPQAAPEPPALPENTRKMMRHISTWNGAVTDKYHWSQSISETTVEVEVEECKAKDIKVDITPTRLTVKCKGNIVLQGKLHEKVTVEECMWHLDDNKIVVSLEKQRETWWKCVLEGDQEIDTTKVESTKSMEEYDGETQGAIRKIMFDQSQKIQGRPTSDQIRTADIMKDAWNAPGSPFRGSEFDPSILNLSGPVPEDFFEDLEKKRIEAARQERDQAAGAQVVSESPA